MIRIGIVDDHALFRRSLQMMLESFENMQVTVQAANGSELQKLLKEVEAPDIILLDVHMPVMDGATTATWMNKQFPEVKIIALSMNDEDNIVLNMLKKGCCAYLLKDTDPDVLEQAIRQVYSKGYFNGDAANISFSRLLKAQQEQDQLQITEREKHFLQLACSDLTYKEIAQQMQLAERTVDGYREALFQKLKVQSRVGLAMEAIRKKLVEL